MLTKLIYVLIGIFAVYSQALGQAKKVTPANDPPGQVIRHAPMPKATRTVVIRLAIFNSLSIPKNFGAHGLAWQAGSLRPTVCPRETPIHLTAEREIAVRKPAVSPWRLAKPEPKFDTTSPGIEGRFLSTSTEGNTVTLRYELLQNDHPPVAVSITLEQQPTVYRTIDLSPAIGLSGFWPTDFPSGAITIFDSTRKTNPFPPV